MGVGHERTSAKFSKGKSWTGLEKGRLWCGPAPLGEPLTCHYGHMLVLVVEDDPAVSGPLIEGSQRNGIETEHVAYASQVLAAATSGQVDVILLDLGLPDRDGLEVLRELRKVTDIPEIIATGSIVVDRVRHVARVHGGNAIAEPDDSGGLRVSGTWQLA